MPRTVRFLIGLLLVMGADSVQSSARRVAFEGDDAGAQESSAHASLKPASATSSDIPFTEYDSDAEQVLLDRANQARAEVGAPRLAFDPGLRQAARAHAEAMFAARQLSHQFDGEPSLPQRLATATRIQLDQEGENVALDFDAEQGHRHLMLSPPHRANLLNPAYNVVGLGVIRSGDRLYIVQDFGHALPNYSAEGLKDTIAAALAQARHQASQPDLARRDLPMADDAACSMAKANKLGTSPVQQLAQRYSVLSYTSLHPESLPANANRVIASHNLRSFSVGACYARTETYPTGAYWVVLALE
jgi:uncharacterized protein YkwD